MAVYGSVFVVLTAVGSLQAAAAGPQFNDVLYDEGIFGASGITFGDVDGDGVLDMVTCDAELGAGVHIGAGDGTFGPRTDYLMSPVDPESGYGIQDIELGDLDGDGDLDIATVGFAIEKEFCDPEFDPECKFGPMLTYFNNGVFYRLNNGDGTFGAVTNLPGVTNTSDLTLADIDGDNDLDIVAIEFDGFFGMLYWFNDGTGSFGPLQQLQTSFGSSAVDSGDLDGDGDIDIAIARSFNHVVDVLLNDGTGNFGIPVAYPTSGARPAGIDIGDANGDGDLDIAVTVDSGSRLNVFTNDGSGGFGAMQSISTGSGPMGVQFADIDDDGDQDVLLASRDVRSMSYHINDGTGTYGARQFFNVGGVSEIAVADLNDDGLIDLGMSNVTFNSSYAVHLNHPDGIDSQRDDYFPVSDPLTLSVLDFNNDSKADIAVSRLSSQVPNIAVMVNAGDGTYPTQIDLSAGSLPYLTTGDVNGDTFGDIVTANLSGDSMSVFINNGVGGYSGAVNTPIGDSPSYPELGDLDNDGDLDYTATRGAGGVMVLMFNDGTGTFGSQVDLPIADNPFRHKLGDVNGDGNLDIVVPRRNADMVGVLLGNGDGTFGAMSSYSTDEQPNGLQLGDLDGDGDLDFVTHNIRNSDPTSMDSISIRFNNGSGVFSGSIDLLNRDMEHVKISDVDDDGDLDLVSANRGQTAYTVFTNTDGTGMNWADTSHLDGRGTRFTETADINEDGVTDVITAQASGFVSIHYGNSGAAVCAADLAAPLGVLNLQDVFAYLALFNAMDPAADLAAPLGVLNLQDVFAYLALFNAGCP